MVQLLHVVLYMDILHSDTIFSDFFAILGCISFSLSTTDTERIMSENLE